MKNLTTEFNYVLPKMICFKLNYCEDNQQRLAMIEEYQSKLMYKENIYNCEDLVIYMNIGTYRQLAKSYPCARAICGMEIHIDICLAYMEFRIQEKKEVDNMQFEYFEPYIPNFMKKDYSEYLPSSYIINEGATILFYSCGKVISKRNKNDKFDKELGFLVAFFKKWWNGSKQSQKNVINSVSDLKTFMFEFFVAKTEMPKEKARKYLANLKVEKK